LYPFKPLEIHYKVLHGKAKDQLTPWKADKDRKSMFDIIVREDQKMGRLAPNVYFQTEG